MGKKGMREHKRRSTKIRILLISIGVVVALSVLLLIQAWVQMDANKKRANSTAELLISDISRIIEENDETESMLLESVKENYIIRAGMVEYILSNFTGDEYDTATLQQIADHANVDEIHIFNTAGVIVGTSVPSCLGMSMDDGEQIGFFKPMLYDKTLSLCQDMVPNTVNGDERMYAMVWKHDGTEMVEVGIEPERLLKELESRTVEQIITDMPTYEGVRIVVADYDTLEILGATRSEVVGENLSDYGVVKDAYDLTEPVELTTEFEGREYYCTFALEGNYLIGILTDESSAQSGLGRIMIVNAIYLAVAAVVIIFALLFLDDKNKKDAILEFEVTHDALTGLFNRKALEDDLKKLPEIPQEQNFVLISLDMNGLKVTNDTWGHEAGDKLLKGASECMSRSIGAYGRLYRVGGDEFTAIIYATPVELQKIRDDFDRSLSEWTKSNGLDLSMAYGIVTKLELPDATITEMERRADEKMYDAKRRHYANGEHDRRRRDRV